MTQKARTLIPSLPVFAPHSDHFEPRPHWSISYHPEPSPWLCCCPIGVDHNAEEER